MLLYQQK